MYTWSFDKKAYKEFKNDWLNGHYLYTHIYLLQGLIFKDERLRII